MNNILIGIAITLGVQFIVWVILYTIGVYQDWKEDNEPRHGDR